MANNYTSFSELLPVQTREERKWVEDTLRMIQDAEDEDLARGPGADAAKWAREWIDEHGSLGFDHEWRDNNLWVYTEESGSVEAVAAFVRMFLGKFHKDKYWTMTWAATCSRPRIGEFDGGAVFVMADAISWMNSDKWFRQRKSRTNRSDLRRRKSPE